MSRYKLELTKERDEKIKSEICSRYGLDWGIILTKSRKSDIIDARRIYCGVLRNIFNLTYSKIGTILNKNHATILHNVQQHDIFVKILKSYKKNYEDIEHILIEDDNYYVHEILSIERKMDGLAERLSELIQKKNNYKSKIKNNGREKLCSK